MTDLASRPLIADAETDDLSSMPDFDPDAADLSILLAMVFVLLCWTGLVAVWIGR